MDLLRPYLSRLIAAALAGLVTWLAGKGIALDDTSVHTLTEAGVVVALTVFQALYAIIHRTIDKKVNPGDAASSHIAAASKLESAELKSVAKRSTF
jgi:uncharacterized membrane protein (DUF441 family)